MIYLDYQATTPLAPEAREAMLPWLERPASAIRIRRTASGREAAAAVEVARERVAALLPAGGPAGLHQRRDRGAQLGDQGRRGRRRS